MRSVLNVGGGNKDIAIPPHFDGWKHDLLDIDPKGNPDVLADARNLSDLPAGTYDAVYCSHNLEHYFRHDAAKVVRGFHHVLKPDGFAQILVPDLQAVMSHLAENKLDVDDFLYDSTAGPISVHDVIYGFQLEIHRSGHDFFAHKTGFSTKSLMQFMLQNGFPAGAAGPQPGFEILGYFFKQVPSDELCKMLNLNRG